MRLSREALDYRVVVRRVAVGPRPFQWEIRAEDGGTPIQVSPGRFTGMAIAYEEGQAWLTDFLAKREPPPRRSAPRRAVQDGVPSTASPIDDEDEVFDRGVDLSDEAAIGTTAPVHSSSIG
jgi:hypothetical protein